MLQRAISILTISSFIIVGVMIFYQQAYARPWDCEEAAFICCVECEGWAYWESSGEQGPCHPGEEECEFICSDCNPFRCESQWRTNCCDII